MSTTAMTPHAKQMWRRLKEWRTKAMGTRKANEEKKNAGPGGITMDSNGNLKYG
jgi:hypothetical protein